MNDEPSSQLTSAAVLIPLVINQNDVSLLFTKRTDQVRHHKGQICFPGGVRDETDTTLWETALRETHEEIGIAPQHVGFLCRLPELITPTDYQITPFIGYVSDITALNPNPAEIAAIFHAPLPHFCNPDNIQIETRSYFGKNFEMPFYEYGPHKIWGATGRMVHSLIEMLKCGVHSNWPTPLVKILEKLFVSV